jgi:hypothetical protein
LTLGQLSIFRRCLDLAGNSSNTTAAAAFNLITNVQNKKVRNRSSRYEAAILTITHKI